ncbi:alpha/beta fold hydrolase (plasmid) [Rhizobium sp. RCAM05350]|uniref:alpha/beta fold hydrolase n=1 Tax=Rhizobium sp. RCAM05350 TaxID=2895568 RepID=UPI002076B5B9|nr:alpha/beta fold hydrolase [Rhizobium sp. RCAM05350]URK89398.1 alpha/beta fold hydrolase [Rhizobium sp. RCAM05350]
MENPSKGGHATLHRLGGDEGSPDLLMIHGFGADRFAWTATAPAFFGSHRVWAVELPGHTSEYIEAGEGTVSSIASAVAEAIDGTLAAPFSVVGHSLGGAVAIELALSLLGRVNALVLLAPAGLGYSTNELFLREFVSIAGEDDAQRVLEMLVSRPKLISMQMVQHVQSFLNAPRRQDALRLIADKLHDTERMTVPQAIPIAAIWGDADTINPPPRESDTRGFHLEILPGVGHLPHVEQARKVNAIIKEVIAAIGSTGYRRNA